MDQVSHTVQLQRHLAALTAPLRFARQQDYQHLQRIKGLEQQLSRICQLALQANLPPQVDYHLRGFLAQIPDPQATAGVRQQGLEACWQALQAACQAARPEARAPGNDQAEPVRQASAPVPLTTSLQALKGIGANYAALLAKRAVVTVYDMLWTLPRRYRRFDHLDGFHTLQENTHVVVQGDVIRSTLHAKGKQKRLEVVLQDGSGTITLWWFRVPRGPFVAQFQQGIRLQAAGVAKRFGQRWQLIHPTIQHVAGNQPDATSLQPPPAEPSQVASNSFGQSKIVPIYTHLEGIHPNQYQRWLQQCLPSLQYLADPIPATLRQQRNLPSLAATLQALHEPPDGHDLTQWEAWQTPWQQRMIYQELLLLQSWLLLSNRPAQRSQGYALSKQQNWLDMAAAMFPFTLTADQQTILTALQAQMAQPAPIQQLIQGDVGSGKTAIALVAAAGVARSGYQVAILAPTELLASQHASKAAQVLQPFGIRSALLTGSISAANRRQCYEELADGRIQVVIGTQALLQEKVQFAALGLLVIDEQHRFGVLQRAKLSRVREQQQQRTPHVLIMTATPIPRTLALTVYGDLDIAMLKSLPPNRLPIVTKRYTHRQREQAYQQVRQAAQEGRQAYVVFPLVEQSDAEQLADLQSATEAIATLVHSWLQGLRVGLLHGKLQSAEKITVMGQFQRGELDVLIATTVIEVGIDIPNATVIVIEHAERYGLSQLHQLRGRVGRGAQQSHCLLLAGVRCSQQAWYRLQVLASTNDGFRIAEEDLALRGPGDMLGTKQAGLPSLTLVNLARDGVLVAQARQDARRLFANDPSLQRSEHQLWRHLLTDYAERHLSLVKVG